MMSSHPVTGDNVLKHVSVLESERRASPEWPYKDMTYYAGIT